MSRGSAINSYSLQPGSGGRLCKGKVEPSRAGAEFARTKRGSYLAGVGSFLPSFLPPALPPRGSVPPAAERETRRGSECGSVTPRSVGRAGRSLASSAAAAAAARSGSRRAEQPGGSRSRVGQREQLISADPRLATARRGRRGETHSRRPSWAVVMIICKQVTCSSPDPPPSVSHPFRHHQLWKLS